MYLKRYHQSGCTNRNICLSPDNENFLLCFLLETVCNLIHNSSKIDFTYQYLFFPCVSNLFYAIYVMISYYMFLCVCLTLPMQMLMIFIHTILFNYNSLIHSWIIFQCIIYLFIHSFNYTVIYLFTLVRNTIGSLPVSLLFSH